MSRPETDVIVVGAGPGGASAAFHLARMGRRVILLERNPRGSAKACGGGMAASVQRWFPFSLAPAVDQVIRRVRFTWCLEDPVTAELPGNAPFWIVRRSVLDDFLVDQAVAAGAEVRYGWAATGIERDPGGFWQVADGSGEVVRAHALVLADGSGSPHAARLGVGPGRPRFASTVSVEVDCEPSEPEMARFEFGLVQHGFCWSFPRQGGYSIGVGTFIGGKETDAALVLARLLPSLGLASDAGTRRHGRLRIWDGHHPLHANGMVAVGDAASLCDPFLAEGLRPALMSGTHAAAAIDRWLAGEQQALMDYSQLMRREWGDSMAWGKRIAQVFYRLPRVGYQLGVKRPTAPKRIAQILSGEMGYGDIAQRVIRRLLLQRN